MRGLAAGLLLAALLPAATAAADHRAELERMIAEGRQLLAQGPRLEAAHAALRAQAIELEERSAELVRQRRSLANDLTAYRKANDAHREAAAGAGKSCAEPTATALSTVQAAALPASDSPPSPVSARAAATDCHAEIAALNAQVPALQNLRARLRARRRQLAREMALYDRTAQEWNARATQSAGALNRFYAEERAYLYAADRFLASAPMQTWLLSAQARGQCWPQAAGGPSSRRLSAAVAEALACLERARRDWRD